MKMEIQKQVLLSGYTSWQIGGPAEFFCIPRTINDLYIANTFILERSLPHTLLGGGSNVLISDQGIRGLVICLREFSGYQAYQKNNRLFIDAFSGVSKTEILKVFLQHKLAPALFLAGLPGDLGGGVAMNAGVAEMISPREFVELTDWIEVFKFGEDPKIVRYEKDELQWTYRHSKGWQPGWIVRVGLSWPNQTDSEILEKVRAANKVRSSKQPLHQPSCGSVFKNPEGHKAAQLIDQCGLKGFRVGGAEVSTKHANFIVNIGGASSKDVWDIIQHIQKVVFEKTKVQLNTEVIKMGEGF